MGRLIVSRLLTAIPILLIVSFIVFVLVDLAPGDPAYSLAGDNPTPEQVERVRHELRLDDSLPTRYVHWVADAVHGDFGNSLANRQPVSKLLRNRVAVTASLAFVSVLLMVLLALPFGILAAVFRNRWPDRVITWLSSVVVAIPPFWLGLVFIAQFAIGRRWFPALGYAPVAKGYWEWFRHLLMPAMALSALPAAELILQLKASLIEVLGRDYSLALRAKGLPVRSVIGRHGLKNAAIPVVTVLGHRLAQLVGYAVIIEQVFTLHGLGEATVAATLNRDITVLMAIVVISTTVVIVVNLMVDVSYGFLNPKVRT